MAHAAALNPCLEHAAWLGASDDVTCCRIGGGDSRAGQRAFIWAMACSQATLGVTHRGAPLMLAGTHRPGETQAAPVSFSS